MSAPTQTDRVLKALREAGAIGVTQADFSGLHGTPDGKPPITRVAARILELRSQGHDIVSVGLRDKCKVYVLRGVEHVEPVMTHEHFEALSLAALAPAPRNAIHDEDNGRAA